MAGVGHNSGDHVEAHPDVVTAAAQGRLRSLVERIERLEEDKAAIAGDLKDVYAEAKGEGFDTKTVRKLISLRKKDKVKLQEEKTLLELYASALGCLDLI
ncbi:DUF2312 domain-containing protein [Asticcacaulis sp.]|uniref:DUF2312 domain-containing protein n=1 Tax=Asticcacaulis sp. TaxID=1872648 RepID=UPI0031E26342